MSQCPHRLNLQYYLPPLLSQSHATPPANYKVVVVSVADTASNAEVDACPAHQFVVESSPYNQAPESSALPLLKFKPHSKP